MPLLERHFKVATRYGGGFVESIDGHSGSSTQRDWFYYVNGIQAPQGAAATAVHKGDHIWWDLHDWSATDSIPAVVGSFPEPFTNGIGGKQLPDPARLRRQTSARLQPGHRGAAPLPASRPPSQLLGTGSGSDSLAVVVGTWSELKPVIAAELIAAGPARAASTRSSSAPAAARSSCSTRRRGRAHARRRRRPDRRHRPTVPRHPTWLVTGTDVGRRDGRREGAHRARAARPLRARRPGRHRAVHPGPRRCSAGSHDATAAARARCTRPARAPACA